MNKELKLGDNVRITHSGGKKSYHQILNREGIIDRVETCLDYVTYYVRIYDRYNINQEEGLWVCTPSMIKAINKVEKEENKMGKYYELINQYKENALKVLYKSFKDITETIKLKDKLYKEVQDTIKTLKEFGNKVDINIIVNKLDPETESNLAELETNYQNKKDNLIEYCEEAIVRVDICETYEQAMDVLHSYGIIDSDTNRISDGSSWTLNYLN